MDGLNTMIIQSKLLVHIFIFKKHSINTPPRVTVIGHSRRCSISINSNNYSKKQIRTNFDLRNSSDLLRLVTRTEDQAYSRARMLWEDFLASSKTSVRSSFRVHQNKKHRLLPMLFVLVTRTGIEPMLLP